MFSWPFWLIVSAVPVTINSLESQTMVSRPYGREEIGVASGRVLWIDYHSSTLELVFWP